jgi:hypothetical protein
MPRQWTDEQRQAQAGRCRQNQPWTRSTGPKSVAGKRKVSQNPRKPASFELADAILTEAYRRLDDHDDLDGYRQLNHLHALVRRRVWRWFAKEPSIITPWKPPKRDGKSPP